MIDFYIEVLHFYIKMSHKYIYTDPHFQRKMFQECNFN